MLRHSNWTFWAVLQKYLLLLIFLTKYASYDFTCEFRSQKDNFKNYDSLKIILQQPNPLTLSVGLFIPYSEDLYKRYFALNCLSKMFTLSLELFEEVQSFYFASSKLVKFLVVIHNTKI